MSAQPELVKLVDRNGRVMWIPGDASASVRFWVARGYAPLKDVADAPVVPAAMPDEPSQTPDAPAEPVKRRRGRPPKVRPSS